MDGVEASRLALTRRASACAKVELRRKDRGKKKRLRDLLAKRPQRRLAVWKHLMRNPGSQTVYVSLSGTIITRPECWASAKADSKYLRSIGITDKVNNSEIREPENVLPYSEQRGSDPTQLCFYCIPESVIEAYEEMRIQQLYSWQVECLSLALPGLFVRKADRGFGAVVNELAMSGNMSDSVPREEVGPLEGNELNDIAGGSQASLLEQSFLSSQLSPSDNSQGNLLIENDHISCLEEIQTEHSPSYHTSYPKDSKSIVYCAPTSGGKTLVAEILMLRTLLFQGKGVLMVLPHVALCSEKANYLKKLWGNDTVGLRVEPFNSSESTFWHPAIDVAVCTCEKANNIVNKLLTDNCLDQYIGLIVLDEIHLLGEPHRGYLLELLMLKVLVARAWCEVRIVGMSATLPNAKDMSAWLSAEYYRTTCRPLELSLFVKLGNEVLRPDPETGSVLRSVRHLPPPLSHPQGTVSDGDHVCLLTHEANTLKSPVLIFCATKAWCVRTAILLTLMLPVYQAQEGGNYAVPEKNFRSRKALLQAITRAAQNGTVCPILAKSILQGIAYHHSGLPGEERRLVERAFINGVLMIVVATSTLAVGVNLPVGRVIIRSTKIGRDKMNPANFHQMAGRAGRSLGPEKADAYIIAKRVEVPTVQKLLLTKPEGVESCLYGQQLVRVILELLSCRLVKTRQELVEVLCSFSFRSFSAKQKSVQIDFESEISLACAYLMDNCLIERQLIRDGELWENDEGMSYLFESNECSAAGSSHNTSEDRRGSVASHNSLDGKHTDSPVLNLQTKERRCDAHMSKKPTIDAKLQANRNIRNKGLLATSQVVLSRFLQHGKLAGSRPSATEYEKCLYRNLSEMKVFVLSKKEAAIQSECSINEEARRSENRMQKTKQSEENMKKGKKRYRDETDDIIYEEEFSLGSLGLAVVEANLLPCEGLEIFADLYKALHQGLYIKQELHVLYLCTPVSSCLNPCWKTFYNLYRKLDYRASGLAEFLGVDFDFILKCTREDPKCLEVRAVHEKLLNRSISFSQLQTQHQFLATKRFYSALLLSDLLKDIAHPMLVKKYNTSLGEIQSLRNNAAALGGTIACMLGRLGASWSGLAAIIQLVPRKLKNIEPLTPECRALCDIDSVQPSRAQALVRASLNSVDKVANAAVEQIYQALHNADRYEHPCTSQEKEYVRTENALRLSTAFQIKRGANLLLQSYQRS